MGYRPDQQCLCVVVVSPELRKHWDDNRRPEDKSREDTIRRLEGLPEREWTYKKRGVYG